MKTSTYLPPYIIYIGYIEDGRKDLKVKTNFVRN